MENLKFKIKDNKEIEKRYTDLEEDEKREEVTLKKREMI